MNNQEMRIAIAKDVIEHLKVLNLVTGTYICSPTVNSPPPETKQEAVGLVEKTCEVCGLGAMFLSHVRLFDDIEDKLFIDILDNESWRIKTWRQPIENTVGTYFDALQLDLIEIAYECYDVNDEAYRYKNSTVSKLIAKAIIFGDNYSDKYTRLNAIMENVIKNNGEFIP